MKNLLIVVVLVAIGIAGFGYYRGWFAVSTNNAGQQPSATVTVDKNKLHADEQEAKDKLQGLKQDAKNKLGDRGGQSQEPQHQP